MIAIKCRCGEVLHADTQHVGRMVRCRCGRTHRVEAPKAAPTGSAPRRRTAGGSFRGKAAPAGTKAKPRRPATAIRYPAARLWTERAALAYFALSVTALIVIWIFGDRTWWGTTALFSGRWLLLLPLPPIIIAAAVFDRRSLAVLAAATVIVLVPVMGLRLGVGALFARGGTGEPVRVASLNAAGNEYAVRNLLALMSESGVDVGVLQECPSRFAAPPGWHAVGKSGLCAFSRHPIRSAGQLDMTDVMRAQSFGGTSAAERYEVALPGRTVVLVNVHLETARRGLRGLFSGDLDRMDTNLVFRRAESRQIFEWASAGRPDVVIAGDFNMPVESAIYRANWGSLANAFSRAGRGFGFTRDNGWIRVRIDHVLHGPHWRSRRAWVGPAIGSDHRPVFAELVPSRDE